MSDAIKPAIPRRWYCNKCGHYGETGPEHDVCAGYPQQKCQYTALEVGPFWSQEQMDAAIAAERERCAKLCDEIERKHWLAYKASGGSSSHVEGLSDGANECADAIRNPVDNLQQQ